VTATPPAIAADRAYDINLLAWHHFSTPVAKVFAHSYLRQHRGLDLTALETESPGLAFGWSRRDRLDDPDRPASHGGRQRPKSCSPPTWRRSPGRAGSSTLCATGWSFR